LSLQGLGIQESPRLFNNPKIQQYRHGIDQSTATDRSGLTATNDIQVDILAVCDDLLNSALFPAAAVENAGALKSRSCGTTGGNQVVFGSQNDLPIGPNVYEQTNLVCRIQPCR